MSERELTLNTDNMFMDLIQAHERSWGMDQYPGRPTLAELLQRPVVVFWSGDDKAGKGRYTITVHDTVDELNSLLLDMLLASKVTVSSSRRLSRIYVKQKQVKIRGIQLLIGDHDRPEKGEKPRIV